MKTSDWKNNVRHSDKVERTFAEHTCPVLLVLCRRRCVAGRSVLMVLVWHLYAELCGNLL